MSIPGQHLRVDCQHSQHRKIDGIKKRRTPFAETVQDGAVLSEQCSFHDLELQGCVLGRVVDAINGEFVGTERAGVVPGVVAGDGSCIGTASVHLADSVEVWITIASKAVVNPFLRRETVVVLLSIKSAMALRWTLLLLTLR